MKDSDISKFMLNTEQNIWTETGTGKPKPISRYELQIVVAKNISNVEDWLIFESFVDDSCLEFNCKYLVMEWDMSIEEFGAMLPFGMIEPIEGKKGHYRMNVGAKKELRPASVSLHTGECMIGINGICSCDFSASRR